jgi:hypothetical protein
MFSYPDFLHFSFMHVLFNYKFHLSKFYLI